MKNIHMAAIAAAVITALAVSPAQAQSKHAIKRIGIRTNIATVVAKAPSLGADLQWGDRWQAGLSIAYGDWGQLKNGGHSSVMLRNALRLEGRRYFKATSKEIPFGGLYLGASASFFRIQNALPTPSREGTGVAVGPVVGYTFRISSNPHSALSRLTVDLAAGAGYLYQNYNEYEWYAPLKCNRLLNKTHSHSFGITHIEIGVAYHFSL